MSDMEHVEDTAWQLKMLTASDAAATTNMTRHATAVALLLAGRRQVHRGQREPEVAACFEPSNSDRRFLARITSQTGIDQILATFDVDDAAGPSTGMVLVRHEGDVATFYDACRLWAPAGGGRAVLVPVGTQDYGHFVFRKGAAMRHAPGRPAKSLDAGFRRASTRLRELLETEEVRSAGTEGWMHVLGTTDGVITTTPTKIAA